MKWIARLFLALVIVAAVGVAVLATRPGIDALCVAQTAHDRLRHIHPDWQCIHYAASRGDTAAIDASIGSGTPVDASTGDGATPLALAAAHGHLMATKNLLARGAVADGAPGRSDTPLQRAAAGGHAAVVRALIAAGADVNARNTQGRTALWIDATRATRRDTEIAHSLVNAGAAIDNADTAGDTPLLAAARSGSADLLGFLMAHGADAAHRNRNKQTALFIAVIHGHTEAVRQLLARGADPQAQVRGVTPLAAARQRDEDEISRLLRANGAADESSPAAAPHGVQQQNN